ncbi:MAG TPA: LamG domain-containing protein [Candidatus Pacearchaeota archaeon]|nr:LamG domain-containing protein [Candidatus Pacearchaeota archaeon]HQM24356.1 LamG domain-containing protein [Candidatus Pacearchaeota archaeon]
MNKSFTLIEILVVIVVIGILSAFIFVGTSSITNSANIAKSQAFIESADQSLLLSRMSNWKLNESSGITIYDSWGNSEGTLSGTPYPEIKNSGCVSNNCLNFNGSTAYVSLNAFPNISNLSSYTISAWVKITTGGSTQQALGFGSSSTNAPITNIGVDSANKPIFQHRDDLSNIAFVHGENTINDNKWHLINGIRYLSNNHRIFVDGVLQLETDPDTVGTTTVNLAAIGVLPRAALTYFWNGLIDDVRVYNQSISSSYIEQYYYLGINKLFKSKEITFQEFNQRIVELRINLAEQ